MSLKNQIARRRLKRRGPIATLMGILTASGVTLIGLAVGLDPFTILYRASISAVLMCAVVSFGLSVVDVANTTNR